MNWNNYFATIIAPTAKPNVRAALKRLFEREAEPCSDEECAEVCAWPVDQLKEPTP